MGSSRRRRASQKDVEKRFSKVLQKRDTHMEQHIKYFSRHETAKKDLSPDKPPTHHYLSLTKQLRGTYEDITMSSAERQHMLNTLSKGY